MITKRQLGIGMMAVGLVGLIGAISADLLTTTEFSGFGPVQRRMIFGALALLLLGASLYPLGDKPV